MKRPFVLNPAHHKLQSALEMSGENHNFGPDRIAITKLAMIFDSHLEERAGDYTSGPLMKLFVLVTKQQYTLARFQFHKISPR